MKEDFLHYVWKFQKLDTQHLKTIAGEVVEVVSAGQQNVNSGPDFFNAQLRINKQHWAGNVEIHIKSSHWYAHHHEVDPAYDSVILHVVWEYDIPIFRKNEEQIPTLELKDRVFPALTRSYRKLFANPIQWIPCESYYPLMDPFLLKHWLGRLFFERLEEKSKQILERLEILNNHWEALFFVTLGANFGLKVNVEAFKSIAESVDFRVISKYSQQSKELECILFGQAGFLDGVNDDLYYLQLKEDYAYLKRKHHLTQTGVIAPKYFRLRPPNFPTIRLSQFAAVWTGHTHLFSKMIKAESREELHELFKASASTYWDTHYNFGVISANRKKTITPTFIDLLLVNTVIPIKFCYAKYRGIKISESLIELASSIPKEKNNVISKFDALQPTAQNAMDSQGLLQLKNQYCNKQKCLQCMIGNTVLNRT